MEEFEHLLALLTAAQNRFSKEQGEEYAKSERGHAIWQAVGGACIELHKAIAIYHGYRSAKE